MRNKWLLCACLIALMVLVGGLPKESLAQCYPDAPAPEITLISELPSVYGTVFVMGIDNKNEIPTPLFHVAPDDLQPCGMNYSSSRTWASIHDAATGVRLYGHCALRNPPDLDDIRIGENHLNGACEVYIDLHDRVCDAHYTSNAINLCSTCLVIDSACDPNASWDNHGDYVSCVDAEANRLLTEGYFPSQDKADECVTAAAESTIGQ